MASPKTTLIIPVESQVRELDAKILRGVYMAKSMRSLSDRMFAILRQLGHEIVAWDEEALVRFRPEDYYRRRLSAKAVGLVSHLFAWGEDDAESFRKFPEYPGVPIYVTGDLMRPDVRGYFDEEVADLRRRFGEFILINTNFGYVNAFASRLNLIQKPKIPGGTPVNGENTLGMTSAFARGLSAHKQALFLHFRELIPALADAMPDYTIVARPHPAEDHRPWQEAASGRANVRVVNEKSVIPWLIAAKALVHNGCTTAVEAAVLGTPAVSYRPVTADAFDLELPNALSDEAFSLEELLAKIRAISRGELRSSNGNAQRAILERHIASLEGPLAADRMVSALCAAGYDQSPPARPAPLPYVTGWLHLHARTAVKQINRRRAGTRNANAFHDHRFPGTSVDDIRDRIQRFSAHLKRFANHRVSQISNHIYRIHG
jgi:surface carbohydrate biosynthesis protein